jgi:hypothetical protein
VLSHRALYARGVASIGPLFSHPHTLTLFVGRHPTSLAPTSISPSRLTATSDDDATLHGWSCTLASISALVKDAASILHVSSPRQLAAYPALPDVLRECALPTPPPLPPDEFEQRLASTTFVRCSRTPLT